MRTIALTWRFLIVLQDPKENNFFDSVYVEYAGQLLKIKAKARRGIAMLFFINPKKMKPSRV